VQSAWKVGIGESYRIFDNFLKLLTRKIQLKFDAVRKNLFYFFFLKLLQIKKLRRSQHSAAAEGGEANVLLLFFIFQLYFSG
jgi:hypothetical protein